jgi:hypothetical protein
MTLIEKLNAITRLSIYLSIILFLFTYNQRYLIIAPITMIITVFIIKTHKNSMELYFNSYKDSNLNNENIIPYYFYEFLL